jgi:hypothetical protein
MECTDKLYLRVVDLRWLMTVTSQQSKIQTCNKCDMRHAPWRAGFVLAVALVSGCHLAQRDQKTPYKQGI